MGMAILQKLVGGIGNCYWLVAYVLVGAQDPLQICCNALLATNFILLAPNHYFSRSIYNVRNQDNLIQGIKIFNFGTSN